MTDSEIIHVVSVVRLHWKAMSEAQRSLVETMLNTRLLAPHGCMSWHSRRDGDGLRATALWDDRYAARLFVEGRLADVVRAADLDRPELSLVAVPEVRSTFVRPRLLEAA